jgi:hypothetical protein
MACGRNVVHGSDSPENGEREIGKTSILAAPPAELTIVSLLYIKRLRAAGLESQIEDADILTPGTGWVGAALWFKDSELVEWEQCITPWLRE